MFKIISKYLALLFLCTFAQSSFSACSNSGGYFNIDVNFGNVIVQRDSPVGTSVAVITPNVPNINFGCSYSWVYRWELSMFTSLSSLPGVYNTNVSGIGVKLSNSWGVMPYDANVNGNTYMVSGIRNTSAELIKISNTVVPGNITTGVAAKASIANEMYVGQLNISGGKIIPVQCSINTPSLTFPMGDVLASSFGNSVGTTPSGAQNTQSLGLNCDSGANINVMLQGSQNPDVSTTTSVLALTGQGNADVAKGVGVQLLYNGSPLVLNNRIVLKQSTGGQETFPITARYYQTKTSVSTGKANASATLDLTYQ